MEIIMAQSQYMEDGHKSDGKEVSNQVAAFESWLSEKGAVLAVDGAPYDGKEGGYIGTVNAEDLLSEYIAEHPDQDVFCDELTRHCWEIGEMWISPEECPID
jgi:hypothetical protein